MEEARATPGRTLDFTLRSVDFAPQMTRIGKHFKRMDAVIGFRLQASIHSHSFVYDRTGGRRDQGRDQRRGLVRNEGL